MPLCASVVQSQQLLGAKERAKTPAEARERVGAALLAIDHTDRVPDDQTLLAKGGHRLAESPSGRDDGLDEAHELAGLERALDAFGRAVFLGLTADDDEWQIGRHRCRSGQRDGTESRSGETHGVGLARRGRVRYATSEGAQQVRVRLEAVLVQVVARAPPGAEY